MKLRRFNEIHIVSKNDAKKRRFFTAETLLNIAVNFLTFCRDISCAICTSCAKRFYFKLKL